MIFLLLSLALAYKELGYDPDAVRANIRAILQNPNADDGNYGPFLIRLAWHCAGTYRRTDGRGGCDGARIRFDVERSWGDNAGLIPGPHEDSGTITALELLAPTKYEFGNALSWGDLIVLAGSTAIEEMGGPQIDFCGGRVDAYEGYSIEELNVEMIYVNAGNTSAADVREKFDKMDMNDQETVALIGGGHAFGRCHASRSGFDGPWTTNPSLFDNEYFRFLLNLPYQESTLIPGQFEAEVGENTYIMLHGDVVLLEDESFKDWVEIYSEDEDLLRGDFKAAWEKLMNRDMGLRPCAGTIPEITETGVDYEAVKSDVLDILPDPEADSGSWGPLMVRLGWHCSGTYRVTDHIGGCNGARIRHSPEADWGSNTDVDLALQRLEPIYNRHQPGLSWADLIIIASTASLEEMGALPMPFCPGRTDVTAEVAAQQSRNLNPEIYLDAESATAPELRESMKIMGFTDREMVVLNGGGHSVGQCHHFRSGFQGPWTPNPTTLSNDFFQVLLERTWVETEVPQTGRHQLQDQESGTLTMLFSDLLFRNDDRFRAIVEEYAQDNDLFLEDFRDAWIKLVNADRFGDVCVTQESNIPDLTSSTSIPETTKQETSTTSNPATTKSETTTSTNPPMIFPVPTNGAGMDMASEGQVTVNCNNEPASKTETSALTWTFIIVLLAIIIILFAVIFILIQPADGSENLQKTLGHPLSEKRSPVLGKRRDSWNLNVELAEKEPSE